MNEHAGAASALSVLIVVAFAILLHDRPARPSPSQPQAIRAPATPPAAPSPTGPAPNLIETRVTIAPTQPLPEPARPREPSPLPTVISVVARSPVVRPLVAARPAPVAPTAAPVAPNPLPPSGPRGAFTTVKAGETLADVARRVYGTIDSVESLWRANRDQLARVDSPVNQGSMLRTP